MRAWMRAMACKASKEWPPTSKKLSFDPMLSTLLPVRLAHRSAKKRSVGVRGATRSPEAPPTSVGRANALRSTFPLEVSGMRSTAMNCCGIM